MGYYDNESDGELGNDVVKRSIKQLAEDDRPREKLVLHGRSTLSNAELIGIIIGSGSKKFTAVQLAQEILNKVDNKLSELARLNVDNLCQFDGIGPAKAISIITALEIGRRRNAELGKERKRITSSKNIYEVMHPVLGDLDHEEFWVLHLNNNNHLLEKQRLSQGGWSATVADQRQIFKRCYELKTQGIILCHNHPSGSLKASAQDINLTKAVKKSSEFLEFRLLDHVIVTQSSYYSMADNSIM